MPAGAIHGQHPVKSTSGAASQKIDNQGGGFVGRFSLGIVASAFNQLQLSPCLPGRLSGFLCRVRKIRVSCPHEDERRSFHTAQTFVRLLQRGITICCRCLEPTRLLQLFLKASQIF